MIVSIDGEKTCHKIQPLFMTQNTEKIRNRSDFNMTKDIYEKIVKD